MTGSPSATILTPLLPRKFPPASSCDGRRSAGRRGGIAPAADGLQGCGWQLKRWRRTCHPCFSAGIFSFNLKQVLRHGHWSAEMLLRSLPRYPFSTWLERARGARDPGGQHAAVCWRAPCACLFCMLTRAAPSPTQRAAARSFASERGQATPRRGRHRAGTGGTAGYRGACVATASAAACACFYCTRPQAEAAVGGGKRLRGRGIV